MEMMCNSDSGEDSQSEDETECDDGFAFAQPESSDDEDRCAGWERGDADQYADMAGLFDDA